jgi:hypothetical protein
MGTRVLARLKGRIKQGDNGLRWHNCPNIVPPIENGSARKLTFEGFFAGVPSATWPQSPPQMQRFIVTAGDRRSHKERKIAGDYSSEILRGLSKAAAYPSYEL